MRHGLAICLMLGLVGPTATFGAVETMSYEPSVASMPAFEQRQDVVEISAPPSPTGPASPPAGCSPANPVC